MILLDSDHLTILALPENSQCIRLKVRMSESSDPIFTTTIVNAEEQLRGWLAEINRHRMPTRQVSAYAGMWKYLAFLRPFPIVAFDARAAAEFERLRKAKVHIGSMDLKIACIALVHNALLLSANLRDFRQVPGLRVENWLEEE